MYYGGKNINVDPVIVGDICKFSYQFPDEKEYSLCVSVILCAQMRQELTEAGFNQVDTYGDFQEDFSLNEAGFIIHIAKFK